MEETMSYRKFCLVVLFLALFTQLSAQQGYNLALIKRDTQIFEQIIEEVLKQNFNTPFALTAEPKGAYLQGYGVTFSFQLNLNRATIRTPFGEMKSAKSAATSPQKRSKEDQVRIVMDSMIDCLADYGHTVKQLSPRDRISIHAHVIDRNELDPARSVTVLVLTVLKDDIDQLSARKLSLERFKQRVHVLQY